MYEVTALLVTALLGASITVYGALRSLWASRRDEELEREFAALQSRLARHQALMRLMGNNEVFRQMSPEEKKLLFDSMRALVDGPEKLADEETGAFYARTSGERQTGQSVKVQREDGSTATFEVDPSDADSIVEFVKRAKRDHTERVLAVH